MGQVEYNLVELWEIDINSEKFVANGGVVVDRNGLRRLVTAAHVTVEYGEPRTLMVRSKNIRTDIPKHAQFHNIDGSDLAEMKLPPGEGLPVAESANLQEPLHIKGSIGGIPFHMRAKATDIDYEKVVELTHPENVELKRGQRIFYHGIDERDTIGPGSSGSLITDSLNRVIGINTGAILSEAEQFKKPAPPSRRAAGIILGK